ncbi:hypothetical protein ElyMa_005787100 [Elysia marginata]|uniref:Uncharacterized protein n=1 Tax=Elysia marginata TaxID=1093978 RepID=A0AAV4FST4_9GAST|nr:hypothetical protein ElyMa_005787100 [Elysia marginata]
MENYVQRQQMMEIQEYGRTRSDSEDDEFECYEAPQEQNYLPVYAQCMPSPERSEDQRGTFLMDERPANRNTLSGHRSLQEESTSPAPPPLPKPRSKSVFKALKGKIPSKHKKMHAHRSSEMTDHMANMIYQFRSVGADELCAPEASSSSNHHTEQPEPYGDNVNSHKK